MPATMKVLYGPPGTGKTFRAAREAVRVIDPTVTEADVTARHKSLVEQGRIIWVTFHPSYSYEDFVEGFRPFAPSGGLVYVPVDGPFKIACERARGVRVQPQVGQRIGLNARYEVVAADGGGVALKSIVKRKDANTPESVQYAPYWMVDYLRKQGVSPEDLSIAGDRSDARREVAERASIPTTMLTNSSHIRALYEFILEQEAKGQPEPVVLVIDEINRADLSRIFGELMTLIEVDKREGASEERRVQLPYSQQIFSVPPTLSMIGTMNTADRSLAVIDVALRRRFDFEEVEPDPLLCPANYDGIDVQKLLGEWNHRISALRSREYRIGHAELMKDKLDATRDSSGKAWSSDAQLRGLASIMRTKVVPLLVEYFHDDWRKAEVVLGRSGLLEKIDFADVAALAGDFIDLDLTDYSSFKLGIWWDPMSDKWDAQRFRKILPRAGS